VGVSIHKEEGMSIIKRLFVVSGLAGLLGAMAFAVPAQAGSGAHAKCTITGNAKTTPPVGLLANKGIYEFDSATIDCVVIESPPLKVVTMSVTVSSTGEYKNIVCGTGKAIADEGGVAVVDIDVGSNSKIGPAGYAAVIEDLKYEVEFVATEGILYWHNSMGKVKIPVPKPLDPVSEKPHDEKARYEGGTVQLLPPSPLGSKPPGEPTPPDCTKSFDVIATIDISDPLIP
jgi:hypothetical protein